MRERLNVMLNYLRENKVNITTNASEELIKKAVTKKLQEENPELEYECPVCGNSIPDVDICPFCGITMLGGENSEETIEPENLDSDIENMEDIIYEEEDVVLPKSQKQDVPAQRQVVTTKLSKEKKEKAISIIKQHNKERAELTKIRLNKERSSRGKRRITEVRKMTSEIVSPEIKTVQYILEKLAENGIGYTETLQRIRITPTIKCAVKCFCQLKTKKNAVIVGFNSVPQPNIPYEYSELKHWRYVYTINIKSNGNMANKKMCNDIIQAIIDANKKF